MNIMWQEIQEQPASMKKSIKKNNNLINEIVKAAKQRHIEFVLFAARGTSDNACIYAKYVFEYLLGIPVVLAAPSIITIYNKGLKLSNGLVIGVSQSGEAVDVLEIIKEAKRQNALTISITNFENSPLALEAQIHLHLNTGIERSVAATKTFTAQMYLMAQLIAKWNENQLLLKEIETVPDQVSTIFDSMDNVIELAQKLSADDNCFVLARGINYAIALETALKIQETTNIHALAYATSDFYHGPITMINQQSPVILFAPNGPSYKDVVKMGMKLEENNAKIITVTNSTETEAYSKIRLSIPNTINDVISPFYNIVVAQMLACQIAVAKGLDPDQPKGLNKVTITK